MLRVRAFARRGERHRRPPRCAARPHLRPAGRRCTRSGQTQWTTSHEDRRVWGSQASRGSGESNAGYLTPDQAIVSPTRQRGANRLSPLARRANDHHSDWSAANARLPRGPELLHEPAAARHARRPRPRVNCDVLRPAIDDLLGRAVVGSVAAEPFAAVEASWCVLFVPEACFAQPPAGGRGIRLVP